MNINYGDTITNEAWWVSRGHRCKQNRWTRSSLVVLGAVAVVVLVLAEAAPTNGGPTIRSLTADCPPAAILFPCTCQLAQILCYNQNLDSLQPVFERVAQYLGKQNASNTFIRLELDGLPIQRLEANFLHGINFEKIALRNLKYLERIDKQAFQSTATCLQQLSLEETTSQFIRDDNLAELSAIVNSLPNLERLYLDAYNLTTIPRYVFNSSRLIEVSFNYNRLRKGQIKKVESEAFVGLPNINTIDLYDQSIDHIASGALKLPEGSHKLWVYLQNNRLVEKSLEGGSFSDIGRRVELYLGDNNLTYVDQKVFAPYFANNLGNMANLKNNPIRMDCRNKWIASLKWRHQQIENAVVEHFKMLVDLKDSDYSFSQLNCLI